ncbi:MAG: hypothetical protein QM674_01190 [Burkholderiaceae bacterium]
MPVATPQAAEAALAASRYKEAIEHFKTLLKRESDPAWLDGLAAAYAGRADQLAAKGMLKEALALWRTRADACGVPLLAGPYLEWLLQSGDVGQALALLRSDALTPEDLRRLAPAVLVAPETLLAGVSAEHPLLRHRAAAQAALAAVAHADDAALAEALQAIPFRSPYRDLRSLLKALALMRTDPVQAAEALARVSDAGGFERLAEVLRVALLPADQWLDGLRGLDDAGRMLVLELQGCPEPQRPLVMALAQSKENDLEPMALYDLLVRHRGTLPEGMAPALCLRLLPHAPRRANSFAANFGPLPAGEIDRIWALAAELDHDHDGAVEHWLSCVDQWRVDPAMRRHAALVLRHLADDRRFHHGGGTSGGPALRWLAQSLELDPADREAELRLLRALRERGDLKGARTRLDAARERFPDDAAVLLEAVQTALASGAFKKAIGLAKQVLAIDPINPQVRSVIGQAHLSHARKQLCARNPKMAQRELDEARGWLRGSAELATLGLLRGLAAEATAEGDVLLRQAFADLGGTLVGAYHLALESTRARVAAEAVLQRAGARLDTTPDMAQLTALAHALNAARADDRDVRRVLDMLQPMLKRAATVAQGSESELTLVCEALLRQGQNELTQRFAATALTRWPGRPAFVYFELAGRYQSEPLRMPVHEQQRLEQAFAQARAQDDRRSASRMAELLREASGFGLGGVGGFDDFDDFELDDEDEGFPDDPRVLAEALRVVGGEKPFLDLIRSKLGKAEFDQLRREIGGSTTHFTTALIEILTGAAGPMPGGMPGRMPSPMPSPMPDRTPGPMPVDRPAPRPAPRRGPPPPGDKQPGLFDD